jgi:hypothetical protein
VVLVGVVPAALVGATPVVEVLPAGAAAVPDVPVACAAARLAASNSVLAMVRVLAGLIATYLF